MNSGNKLKAVIVTSYKLGLFDEPDNQLCYRFKIEQQKLI